MLTASQVDPTLSLPMAELDVLDIVTTRMFMMAA